MAPHHASAAVARFTRAGVARAVRSGAVRAVVMLDDDDAPEFARLAPLLRRSVGSAFLLGEGLLLVLGDGERDLSALASDATLMLDATGALPDAVRLRSTPRALRFDNRTLVVGSSAVASPAGSGFAVACDDGTVTTHGAPRR